MTAPLTVTQPGFAAPVADAQACFRAVLDAMAHPGRVVPAGAGLNPPAPLAAATAAVLLTLADTDTPVWLEDGAAADWVRFHCGAPLAALEAAAFAVCLSLPRLDRLNWGTHEAPETGATVILQMPHRDTGPPLRLHGPGLEAPLTACLGPLPADFPARWAANRAAFPRGVDLLLCAGESLAALPRSTTVEPG